MKLRHRIRLYARIKSRELYYQFLGMAPPQNQTGWREWLLSHPTEAERLVLDDPFTLCCPARNMGGELRELEPHFQTIPPHRAAEFRQDVYAPIQRDLAKSTLVRIASGRVAGKGVAVIAPDDCLLSDLGSLQFGGDDRLQEYRYFGNLPRPRKLSGSVGVLSYGYLERNFYHFLIDCLPKLRIFEQLGVSPDRYYVPFRRPYHGQLLEMFGISARQVVPEREIQHIQADNVFVPVPKVYPHPDDVAFLFQRLAAQPWSRVGSRPTKRIYVSRRSIKTRNVLNEEEVMRMLARHGFERYQLEDMSVREQVELFQQAEIIAGPHGAGLGNMVFAPPGATVLEIGTVHRPYPCFQELCSASGHQFKWFIASAVNGRGEESDMVVDVDHLERYLRDQFLENRSAA